MRILVTGATGYIGGRLVPRLLERGYSVRVLVRDRNRVAGREWSNRVDVHIGDLLDRESLDEAFDQIDVAYYLVHSMTGSGDFREKDCSAATNFSRAAAGVSHVVYLGGLLPVNQAKASPHLQSREEVGRILRDALPTTEFRAGPIIGSGSASFELIRHLTERLPVMITPKWVRNPVQPIAVRDILSYLIAATRTGPLGVVEVGAPLLTFQQMILEYAAERGLNRTIIPVPVLTPRLASYVAVLVTPIPRHMATALIEGVLAPLCAGQAQAHRHFPQIQPIDYRRAVHLALERVEQGDIETRWSGSGQSDAIGADGLEEVEGLYRVVHQVRVNADPISVFTSFASIGGENGWYVWNKLWRLRGFIDRIVGGPGLRRGRRHRSVLLQGEAVDFWRVEKVHPPDLLRLRAEMKLPGRAWLQWETRPSESGIGTDLKQTAIYAPKGLWGRLYWWSVSPFHSFIFRDMIEEIRKRGERRVHGEV